MKDFKEFEKKVGVEFKDKDLLTQAFVHRSYLNENPDFKLFHNERLEFLGDAVLELAVTEYLYRNYPDKLEGELTSWRAALVNSKILERTARELGFNDYLLLSLGEKKEEGRARRYILADTLEAFIGALYLDQGFDSCKDFIEKSLLDDLPKIIKEGLYRDAKSFFQEKAQEKEGITPTYSVVEESGPDHNKHFVVGVYLEKKLIAKGDGASKQEAEEAAAKNALKIGN
jgi:ribonuclease-3